MSGSSAKSYMARLFYRPTVSPKPHLKKEIRALATTSAVVRNLYGIHLAQDPQRLPTPDLACRLVCIEKPPAPVVSNDSATATNWRAGRPVAHLAAALALTLGDRFGQGINRRTLTEWRAEMPTFLSYALHLQGFLLSSVHRHARPLVAEATLIRLPLDLIGLPSIEMASWGPTPKSLLEQA